MNIGKVRYSNLQNDLNFVFVDNKELPLICIDIWCKGGISFEEDGKEGTAHFLEHMIFKGSKKIKPGEFDFRIESLGGSSNAATGYDDSHYYVVIPPSNFEESFSLLSNLVFLPTIDEHQFELEKNVVIEEINQQNDQPDENLYNYFQSRVWGEHIYGKTILGNRKDLLSLQKDDLEFFHKKNYNANNVVIAIAGDLPKDLHSIELKEEIPYFKNSSIKKFDHLVNHSIRIGREEIEFEKLELSRLFISWQIPSINNQRANIGFEILASILAEGRNSRLFRCLKEEDNLVESVFADVNSGEIGGLFTIEICSEKEYLEEVESKVHMILEDINSIRKISHNELNRAINIVKSNYLFNLETSAQLTSFYGSNLLWGRKYPLNGLKQHLVYWAEIENFKQITNYLNNNKFTLIANGK